MERKKVIIEMSVLTSRFLDREVERDLDDILLPLVNKESGETTIEEIEIKGYE